MGAGHSRGALSNMPLASGESVMLEYQWKIHVEDKSVLLLGVKDNKISSEFYQADERDLLLQFSANYRRGNFILPQLTVMNVNLNGVRIQSVYCSLDAVTYHKLDLKSGSLCNLYFVAKFYINFTPSTKPFALNYKILVQSCITNYSFQLFDGRFFEDLWMAALNSSHTDCEIQIGPTIIAAHKVILATRSPVFNKILTENPTQKRIVIRDEIDVETFKSLLRFIYTGQQKTAPTQQLLVLAEEFQIETLINICKNAFAVDQLDELGCILDASFRVGVKDEIVRTNVGSFSLVKKGVFIFPTSQQVKTVKIRQENDTIKASVICDQTIRRPEAYFSSKDDVSGEINLHKLTTEWQLKFATVASLHRKNLADKTPILDDLKIELDQTAGGWGYYLVDGLLTKNLWSLKREKWTDVEFHLKDEDRVFVAHRWILSARCPVFAKMFESDMIEATTGSVDIVDITGDVFEEFLHFLYTGQLHYRDGKPSLKELLIVADKYLVSTLKTVCEGLIAPNDDVCNEVYKTALLKF